MTDYYMPADKKEAKIYLRAQQVMLARLLLKVDRDDLNSISQLLGIIHSENDKLNKMLEEYL